jgi:putative ATP-dependent endonuclease of the OLD family
MKLRRIQIANFRGIANLDLAVGDTTVLIGENNTGKTAILDALRFALREVRSRRGCAFDSYDFHLASPTADPASAPAIGIRLTFREDAPGDWGDQALGRLNRSKIASLDATGCAVVTLKVSGRFDPVSQEFVHDWEFQNAEGAAFPGIADTAMAAFQNEVSYYYLAALRDAAKHFDAKGSFWRPFLKESQLSPEKRAEIEGKLSEVNELIVSSHTSFAQVLEKLKEVKDVVTVLGGEDIVSIDAVPGRLFDMLSKAQVNMNTGTGAKVPISRHGEGTQSLAVLTLFNAFLQTWNKGTPIIALEEPEAHLHPSAVRSLWKLIDRIPGQKLISTHSGDLLSEVPPESIVRLHRPAAGLQAHHLRDVSLDANDQRKFNFHIRRDRGELLFARCWILGEGETEATLVSESARIMQQDLERAGIRFVTYQTGISLEPCLQIANGLGIDWVVLADNDAQGAKDHQTVRNYLDGREEAEALFVMPEANIEQHLCANGFVGVYYALLSDQPRQKVTVASTDGDYARQVAAALPSKLKTHAAQQVIEEMRKPGSLVPQLLQNVINAAIKLATTL